MSSYPILKHLHLLFVVLSLTGFIVRGLLMMLESHWLNRRWMRTVPHFNDTLLLVFGLLLLHYGPWTLQHPWLQLKLGLLLVYIGLGFVALRRGRVGRAARINAWWLGVMVYLYMMSLAYYKQPLWMFN